MKIRPIAVACLPFLGALGGHWAGSRQIGRELPSLIVKSNGEQVPARVFLTDLGDWICVLPGDGRIPSETYHITHERTRFNVSLIEPRQHRFAGAIYAFGRVFTRDWVEGWKPQPTELIHGVAFTSVEGDRIEIVTP